MKEFHVGFSHFLCWISRSLKPDEVPTPLSSTVFPPMPRCTHWFRVGWISLLREPWTKCLSSFMHSGAEKRWGKGWVWKSTKYRVIVKEVSYGFPVTSPIKRLWEVTEGDLSAMPQIKRLRTKTPGLEMAGQEGSRPWLRFPSGTLAVCWTWCGEGSSPLWHLRGKACATFYGWA